MSLLSDTLFWFGANHSLLVLFNDATNTNFIVFGFTRPAFEPTLGSGENKSYSLIRNYDLSSPGRARWPSHHICHRTCLENLLLSHKYVWSWAKIELTIIMVIGRDCMERCEYYGPTGPLIINKCLNITSHF